ncbi:DUF3280 domain-containing protein [Methylocystis parvus]|uniref:DUF3280 domain-containing protein n=1 Tax=Methylocystis parvus TaxID=134 RepID=UPI003C74B4B4
MERPSSSSARFGLFAFVAALAALTSLATPANAGDEATPRPIKLAVFDLELDDFSAGGPLAGESAVETARLQRMSALARELLSRSGLFEIVDVRPSRNPMVAEHWLRKCNGCEVDAARELGADMSFIGFFRKISVMEQNLEFRMRDVRTNEFVNISQTDLRGETDESWSRALKFLIRYGLVEPELARRN